MLTSAPPARATAAAAWAPVIPLRTPTREKRAKLLRTRHEAHRASRTVGRTITRYSGSKRNIRISSRGWERGSFYMAGRRALEVRAARGARGRNEGPGAQMLRAAAEGIRRMLGRGRKARPDKYLGHRGTGRIVREH